MWKNIEERGRSQVTIWPTRIACWITKATNTQTGCVIIFAFPLQQWLQERRSMLRYMYIACLIICTGDKVYNMIRSKRNIFRLCIYHNYQE